MAMLRATPARRSWRCEQRRVALRLVALSIFVPGVKPRRTASRRAAHSLPRNGPLSKVVGVSGAPERLQPPLLDIRPCQANVVEQVVVQFGQRPTVRGAP